MRRDIRTVVLTVVAIGIVAAAATAVIYGKKLAHDRPIRSDALTYYLYLPATFLDHDVSFRTTLDRNFGGDYRVADLVPKRRGYLDKHQTGEAIMLVPFFAAGQLAAETSGARTDGFSRPYEIAAVVGGIVYTLLGLLLVGLTLLRWFNRVIVALTLVALTFGTNLFHYATYDAVYSHVFSFALVALVVERTFALLDRPRTRSAVVLGGALGLLADVRLTNLVVAAFPLVLAGWTLRRRALPLGAIALLAGAVVFVPQLLYWYRLTGHPFVNAYGGEPTLHPLHPHLLQVAFSVRKGLFFWAPLLAIAAVGIVWLRRISTPLAIATALTLILHFWIVASWTQWWYGDSLGQRSFVDVLPLFALGLAAAVAAAMRARPAVRYASYAAIVATTFLAAHATAEYWLGHIPFDHTTWTVYLHSFGKL